MSIQDQLSNKTYKYNGTSYKGAKFKITLPLNNKENL